MNVMIRSWSLLKFSDECYYGCWDRNQGLVWETCVETIGTFKINLAICQNMKHIYICNSSLPYILISWVLTWLSLQVIDERCGKPKSLDGASEGLTLVYYHTKKTVILFEDLQTWPFVKRNTNSWISNWQVNFLLLNYLKDIYWPPGRNFRFLPNQLKWFWQKVSLQFQVSSHLIHTGLTPSPTFPPRGAEADMPGVLQYHVESWVWEIWRGVWADEKGVWGCVYAQIWSYDTPLLIHPPPHPR